MKLSEYSVLRPITVLMATLSILVLGYISLGRLPLTLLPEFSSSNLRVSVDYPSSSPEEVERNITRPLEEVLSTLDNLERVQSTSSSNGSNIRLEFKPETDMDMMSLEVRDRIDQVRNNLPDDVDRVRLRHWQSSDSPVFRFSVAWMGEADEFYNVVQEVILRRLERIDGVANVEIRGLDNKQILVDLDQGRMQALGVDVANLSQALRSSNLNTSGGFVFDGGKKYSLRTVGEFQDIEEIAQLPLLDGRLTLADIADIRYDLPEKNSFNRLNSKEAVSVRAFKASTANVVAVCGNIRRELETLERLPQMEGKLSLQIFDDQSEAIMKSLNDLKIAGIYGGLLAMVVLYLFLRKFRSTLVISVAIPVSVVFTFAFMYLLRVFTGSTITLNIISLMGLMVAIGMLVDSSVVVLENIFRHKQEKGLGTLQAAIVGAKEVGLAVLASTATTVVVFVGFLFEGGSGFGRFSRDFGIAVAVALVASLVVALTVTPMLAGRIFTGKEKQRTGAMMRLTRGYGSLMTFMLRWRFISLLMMGGIAYGSYQLITSIDREMMPSVTERSLRLDVFVERSFSLDEMGEVYSRTEKALLDNAEKLQIVSVSSNFNNRTTTRGQFRGNMTVFLLDDGDLIPTNTIKETMRGILPEMAGVNYRFGRSRRFGGGSSLGVEVELSGDDPDLLAQYAEVIKERLEGVPGVKDVQTTLETGDDEIHLSVDRERAEQMGVTAQQVARTVSSALGSRAATRYKSETGEIDVILQFAGGNNLSFQELANTTMENREGDMVPMYAMVDYEYEKGPLSIKRDDKRSVVSVVANTERGGSSFMAMGMIRSAMADLQLPPGYSWKMGRDWRRWQREEQEGFFAILLAVLLMYIIMAALFESFVQPLTIMFCVPFSLIGVALLFYFTDTTFNRNSYLGILVLFGIVVNNGIILINHINTLQRQGLKLRQAIVQGGMDRLRPILMTAATSLFGLAPLTLPFMFPELFGPVQGRGRMWAPVSLAVLGGLTTSTFLTLIILPTVHSYMEDLTSMLKNGAGWMLRTLSWKRRQRAAA